MMWAKMGSSFCIIRHAAGPFTPEVMGEIQDIEGRVAPLIHCSKGIVADGKHHHAALCSMDTRHRGNHVHHLHQA